MVNIFSYYTSFGEGDMKARNVLILVIIAAILVVIVLLTEKPFQGPYGEKQKSARTLEGIKRVPIFEKVKAEDCYRIFISQYDGASSASLSKVNGVWYTNPERKYPAAKANIERLFETLKKAGEGEVVSKNPQNHTLFEVDKASGTRVKFFGKNDILLADVYIGKMGANYIAPTTYVRAADSDEVLSVSGMMMGLFQGREDNWRERTIFELQPENITGFIITQPGQPNIRLARLASDEWTCMSPKSFPIKKDDGTRMANTFARLRASSFIKDYPQKPYEEYGIGPQSTTITALLKDASSTPTLFIGHESKDQPNQYYVRAEGQEQVYLIYKYMRDGLAKTLAELEAKPTPTPVTKPTDMKSLQKINEQKKKEFEKMTEAERKAAVQKKLDEILKHPAPNPKAIKKAETITSSTLKTKSPEKK